MEPSKQDGQATVKLVTTLKNLDTLPPTPRIATPNPGSMQDGMLPHSSVVDTVHA